MVVKTLFAMVVLGVGGVQAGELPVWTDKPYMGCFVGYEARNFDFGLGGDGTSELHLKDRKKRLSYSLHFSLRYVLEEEIKGKWVRRQLAEDGFETAQTATITPEKPITFTATYTGDTKVRIGHEFGKKGIAIRSEIIGKKTANPVRAGVEVVVPDLYRHLEAGLSERELKKKIRRSEIEVTSKEGKRAKFDLYEDENLEKLFPGGARRFAIESERIDGKEVVLATESEELGILTFRQGKKLLHGLSVFWWPDSLKKSEAGCRLWVEVK